MGGPAATTSTAYPAQAAATWHTRSMYGSVGSMTAVASPSPKRISAALPKATAHSRVQTDSLARVSMPLTMRLSRPSDKGNARSGGTPDATLAT